MKKCVLVAIVLLAHEDMGDWVGHQFKNASILKHKRL